MAGIAPLQRVGDGGVVVVPKTAAAEIIPGDLGEGVSAIDPLTDPRWDRFVEQHPFGWITHLSRWKQVLDATFPHMRGFYLTLVDSTGAIKAALPIYSVESWLIGRRLVSIPFATLCDPLVTQPEDMERLFDAAVNLSKRISIPRIEIRTQAAAHMLDSSRFSTNCMYKHHTLGLCEDPERIRGSFHRSCVRQRISRAEQSGFRLLKGRSEAELQQFFLLHQKTRKRKGLPPHPYLLFKSLRHAFAGGNMVELLLCCKEEEAVAGIIVFKYKKRVSVEYSAVNEAYNEHSPVHFLFWNTIKEACLSGYSVLDFGQTSADNQSLMNFKSHWGTKVSDLPHFIYPNDPALSTSLNQDSLAKKVFQYVCNKTPDPALSYLGDFCYRHLG